MKRLSYFILFVMALLPVALASCGSDDGGYTPGAEVSDDNPNVYFSKDNESEVFVENGTQSISLKVMREGSNGALTVPITVNSKSSNLTVPESVTFNDGKTEADLNLTFDSVEDGLGADLQIADGYANPYKINDGSNEFKISILQPIKVCDVTFDSSSVFANETNEIYSLGKSGGNYRFVWNDFLGSGINIKFDVVDSNGSNFDGTSQNALKGTIKFVNYIYDYYGNGAPYLVTVENATTQPQDEEFASWTPTGQTTPVTWFYMYNGSYNYVSFAPLGANEYSGYLYCGYYLYFYFKY